MSLAGCHDGSSFSGTSLSMIMTFLLHSAFEYSTEQHVCITSNISIQTGTHDVTCHADTHN